MVSIKGASGTLLVRAEIADTPAERARGLMGRRDVPPGSGMLFLYERAGNWGGYWMRNTLVPLDIAFVRSGKVVGVFRMEPCRTDPCPLTAPDEPFDSAVETTAGAFAAAGVAAGSSVRVVR